MSSKIFHSNIKATSPVFIWEKEGLESFEELIVSWKALRPSKGHFLISISFKTVHWTPFVNYASWGHQIQKSYHSFNQDIEAYQDGVTTKNERASGFRIRLESFDGADLRTFFTLHACASLLEKKEITRPILQKSFSMELPPLSQMALNHVRNSSLCSPTSTTSVIRYLSANQNLDPVDFAKHVHDQTFDIYGNWVFNSAQATVELGDDWHCWVARLKGMEELIHRLQKGFPVVVSVKGTLAGAPIAYENGHLIAVRGYEAATQKVLCMDPAYATDEETYVAYDIEGFAKAWGARHHLAYVFEKIT